MCRTLYATLLCACLLQVEARRGTVLEPESSEEDVCSGAVTGSVKRNTFKRQQTEKCKCPTGSFVLGENAAYQTLSRYFNPDDLIGLGCACTKCSEIVANSDLRNTAKKQDTDKCKCTKCSEIVANSDLRNTAKKQ